MRAAELARAADANAREYSTRQFSLFVWDMPEASAVMSNEDAEGIAK
jgi:hypothetical protein